MRFGYRLKLNVGGCDQHRNGLKMKKHFATLGVEVHYKAPVKDYGHFKAGAKKDMNA